MTNGKNNNSDFLVVIVLLISGNDPQKSTKSRLDSGSPVGVHIHVHTHGMVLYRHWNWMYKRRAYCWETVLSVETGRVTCSQKKIPLKQEFPIVNRPKMEASFPSTRFVGSKAKITDWVWIAQEIWISLRLRCFRYCLLQFHIKEEQQEDLLQ
jgi:hypothetical protein